MAKSALIDATLVASLSDVFTQDLEDMDLEGQQVSKRQKVYTDQDGTISKAQAQNVRLAKGDQSIVRMLDTFGYKNSTDVKRPSTTKYVAIEEAVKAKEEAEKEKEVIEEVKEAKTESEAKLEEADSVSLPGRRINTIFDKVIGLCRVRRRYNRKYAHRRWRRAYAC